MPSFVIPNTSTTPQTLANLESGVITPSGALVTQGTAITATGFVRLFVQGSLTSTDNTAYSQTSGDLEATITGQVSAGNFGLLFVGSTAYANVTGQIASLDNSLYMLGTTRVALQNSGTIQSSTAVGVGLGTLNSAQITASNSGTIIGATTGAYVDGSYTSARFVNSGTILATAGVGLSGSSFNGAGPLTILNSGVIQGTTFGLQSTGSTTYITNSGTILGGVNLSAASDIYDGRLGMVSDGVYGNEGADELLGGNYGEYLNGGVGDDSLFGGGGDDTLEGEADNDRLLGGAGDDELGAGTGTDTLYGGTGDDTLSGGDGNDLLYGGAGSDSLDGGSGSRDRVLYSDSATGLQVDLDDPGINTGIAAGDVFAGIEDLFGSNGSDGLWGDAGGNILWGAGGNDLVDGRGEGDTIYGGNGNDNLYGGEGNDLLYGGLGADRLDGGAGSRDRAMYSDSATGLRADLQLAATNTGIAAGDTYAGVEDLFGSGAGDSLLGNAGANVIWGANGNDVIYGRDGADTIYGGNGNDVLYGGNGLDRLEGGAGADSFVFNTALAGSVDTIADFSVVDDRILLDNAIFTALGATGLLAGTAFAVGASATTAAHRILYNSATGQLLYDADGNGAGAAVHFATLSPGLALTAADFLIV